MTPGIYATVLETSGYIVGDDNARSGLHRLENDGTWTQLGWPNVRCFGAAFSDARIGLACGNGVHFSRDGGDTWRVATGWEITEVLAVAVSPADDRHIVIGTAHGIFRSDDAGASWSASLLEGLEFFCQTLSFSSFSPNTVLAGTESGIAMSVDNGETFPTICEGTEGAAIRHLTEHIGRSGQWWAATENHGLVRSLDHGMTWESTSLRKEAPLYAVAYHGDTIACTGYRIGVLVSNDGGTTWNQIPFPDPTWSGHAILFIKTEGRGSTVLVGTMGHGVYCLDIPNNTWDHVGLPDAAVRNLYAV